MARRKIEETNIRKIFGLANNKSFAITLPIEMIRDLKWKFGDDVKVKVEKDAIVIKKHV